MQAVGLLAATRTEVEWRLDGADPRMKAILNLDPKRRALRETTRRGTGLRPARTQCARLRDSLRRSRRPAPGGGRGDLDGGPGPLHHQRQSRSELAEPRPRLADRPVECPGRPSAVAEELYLSVLSRRPTAEERAEVATYLASRTTNLAKTQNPAQERLAALRELAWGLLASTEFRFNH